jgi:voltage-gated sodium channel
MNLSNTLNKWQEKSIQIRDNNIFQGLVIAIILISSLTIGARTYNVNSYLDIALYWIDNGITFFFLFELITRIIAEKRWYHFFHYKNGWNWFDTLIVVGSLIPLEESNYVLLGRLLRLFRVMRLISFVPQLRLLTSALLIALPRMGYVALMMFVIFYIYATLGSLLFEHINPILWGDVGISMLTLFRVATFEDWTDVMYETMAVYPLSWIFYISFIFFSAFIFLNMMIGIIINVLEEEHQKIENANPTKTPLEKQIDELQKQVSDLSSYIQKNSKKTP